MKIAIDDNNNVVAFKYQWARIEVEAEVNHDFINEPMFTEHQIPQFYLDNGIVKKRTDDEIKAMPEYNEYIDKNQRSDFSSIDGTDAEFIRALRELLKVESIRSLLSSETQQRIANTELKVEQIKEKYETKTEE